MVSVTPWPYFSPRKDPVPILHEAGWPPGPVWTSGKSRSPPGFDPRTVHPVAQSLYRLVGPRVCLDGRKISPPTGFDPRNIQLVAQSLNRLVGPRACLDGRKISPPTGIRSPDRPACSSVAIPTGGAQGLSGRKENFAPPPGFDPRTVQPVAQSLY